MKKTLKLKFHCFFDSGNNFEGPKENNLSLLSIFLDQKCVSDSLRALKFSFQSKYLNTFQSSTGNLSGFCGGKEVSCICKRTFPTCRSCRAFILDSEFSRFKGSNEHNQKEITKV